MREVWVALVIHGDGDEAVPATFNPKTGMWHPLIAADPKKLAWVRDEARMMSRESGKAIKIVKFTTREDLEVIRWGS